MTTDIIILAFSENTQQLKILLIKRKNEPFKNNWAIPGGFVDMNETVEECAKRELLEETNLSCDNLSLLTVASDPKRDPRGRTISAIFWTIIAMPKTASAGDDAAELNWFDINNIPKLAFDHDQIISYAIEQLKFKINLAQHFQNFFKNPIINKNIDNIKKLLK